MGNILYSHAKTYRWGKNYLNILKVIYKEEKKTKYRQAAPFLYLVRSNWVPFNNGAAKLIDFSTYKAA